MALHYVEAGKILDRMFAPGAKPFSLKKMLYSNPEKKVSLGVVFALVSETLKYKQVLDDLLDNSGIMKNKELHGKGHILHAMLYDLMFGKKKSISGGGALKKMIVGWSTRLQAELVKMKIKYKIRDFSELIPEHLRQPIVLPRWVRVNHLMTDLAAAKSFFEKEGWVEMPFETFFKQLDEMQEAQAETDKPANKKMAKVFCVDRDLHDLLAFPPLTDFHEHPLLLAGHIVLQDKASALSGAALKVPASNDSVALDACAAPGQKTSQVAQSMNNLGKLFAFDLDKVRLDTLKKLCRRNGLKNLTAVNGSFLEIDVQSAPYCDVEYILLDPSCSGSGIVNRLDYFLSSNSGTEYDVNDGEGENRPKTPAEIEKLQKERVLKLQEFQLSMIKKAMTFPRLRQLVYSTCSIHDEENEQVVEKASKFSDAFQVAKVLPQVPMRGLPAYPHGEMCVRTVPSRDHTIGFFVSTFERKSSHPLPPASSSSSTPNSNAKKRKVPEPESELQSSAPNSISSMEVDSSASGVNHTSPLQKTPNSSAATETSTSRPAKKAKFSEASTPLDTPTTAGITPKGTVNKPLSSAPASSSTASPHQPAKNKNKNKNKHRSSSKPLVR